VLKETFQKICISLGFERKCRNMHRRRGTGIHKSISSLKLLPLLIHRKISQRERERERESVKKMDRKLTMPRYTVLCLYHRDNAELVKRA
jgi:hypothetical protein